jgi:hypothetical protein
MEDELLKDARHRAEPMTPSMRASALLRIARAESGADIDRARKTLIEGMKTIEGLSGKVRNSLLEEARVVAAAVAPKLLADIRRDSPRGLPERFGAINVLQTMLKHGHVDAAFDYLMGEDDSASFPFLGIGGVLNQIDSKTADGAARRMNLLRHAVELWRRGDPYLHPHERSHFVQFLGHFWKELPEAEALGLAREIVNRAAEEMDAGTSAGYPDEVRFSSVRQHTLFQIFHVLRHLDPALAQSLIDSHDQLAAAVRRYPNGLETMLGEANTAVECRKADGATCEGGYVMVGNGDDFDHQRMILDAVRRGDFRPSIEDALEKYREDTSPDTRNYAPKEYWPSTGAFRRTFYQAGSRLGAEASKLLEEIPDDELRVFAAIELAAALGKVPEPSITSMKSPNPPSSKRLGGRIVSPSTTFVAGANGRTMRSPDGRLIRCPQCSFEPREGMRWSCKCGHAWNTFWTSGRCPACHFEWEVTQCPRCGGLSKHGDWYVSES